VLLKPSGGWLGLSRRRGSRQAAICLGEEHASIEPRIT